MPKMFLENTNANRDHIANPVIKIALARPSWDSVGVRVSHVYGGYLRCWLVSFSDSVLRML